MASGLPRNVTGRIIIHAGFAKCGSASIRTALFQNFRKLQKHNVFVFDKDLRIARTAADLVGTPIWFLEQARKRSETPAQRLAGEIAPLLKRKEDHLAILSAENLANPGMAKLFAGLDGLFELGVVLYLRPQLHWIPSAWKQLGLKAGVPLSNFVSQCIDARTPGFTQVYSVALASSRIRVRK